MYLQLVVTLFQEIFRWKSPLSKHVVYVPQQGVVQINRTVRVNPIKNQINMIVLEYRIAHLKI